MDYYRVEFGGLDGWLWFHYGDLAPNRLGWTQQPDHWTLYFLEHSGGITLNKKSFGFSDGFVALVGPGVRAGFMRVGQGTPHYALTFGIVKRIEVVALPYVCDLGAMKEVRRAEMVDANEWLIRSIGRPLAAAYNLLWSIAKPSDVLKSSGALYDLEELVMSRLAEPLSVAEIAGELQISQSHLLRLVKAEHGLTIQEYLKEKRTEVARNMVVTTDMPLKAIAARTGMPNLQYFNKAIRAASGLSPRALRALAQNRTPH